MSKQNGNKGRRFDRAFKEEAVRLLQTSGRRQRQIAGDLGISVSALGRWTSQAPSNSRQKQCKRCRAPPLFLDGSSCRPVCKRGGTTLNPECKMRKFNGVPKGLVWTVFEGVRVAFQQQ